MGKKKKNVNIGDTDKGDNSGAADSKGRNKNGRKKGSWKKPLIFTSFITVVLLVIAYLSVAVYFQYHFFKDTYIGGIDCSYMTADEVEAALNDGSRTYYLEIVERDGAVEHVTAQDIGLKVTAGIDMEEIKAILKAQNSYGWPLQDTSVHEIDSAQVSYDEALLLARFNTLKCLDTESMKDAAPPELSYSDGVYSLGNPDPGTRLDVEKTKALIREAVAAMKQSINLEESGCYLVSASDNEDKYTEVLNALNKYVGTKITLTFKDELEPVIIDDKNISSWMSVDADMQIIFDMEAIESFVSDIASDIETMGRTRSFKNSYGNTINVSGGDYGWWVSKGKEAENIVADIKNGQDVTRELTYLQTAASFGESDLGDTYIEVNLLEQHLFCYKDGTLITECDIISGENSTPTPVGVYRMRFMFKNYTFNRPYFDKTTAYWMVFYGDSAETNIGLAACDWRSDFGGTTYLYNGTHGSIFLPPDSASIIYNELPNDIPVIIYKTK